LTAAGAGYEEQRERTDVYGGWWRWETPEDVEEQEALVDRYAERSPGMVDRTDAAIARELLRMVRESIERHGGALQKPMVSPVLVRAPAIHEGEYPSNRVARCMAPAQWRGIQSGGFWPHRTGRM
jgi:hypothetical protein